LLVFIKIRNWSKDRSKKNCKIVYPLACLDHAISQGKKAIEAVAVRAIQSLLNSLFVNIKVNRIDRSPKKAAGTLVDHGLSGSNPKSFIDPATI